MRKYSIKKQFYVNQKEDDLIKLKSKKAGLSESEFLRSCIKGYKIKEQPTKEIREFIKQITGIANNINQIARVANTIKDINNEELEIIKNKINDFIVEFEKKFIREEMVLMAIIKIKNIKSNLHHIIDYGKNGDKTENGALVSSINCGVETAYEEMALIKKFYQKEDGILGYHIIQSFDGFETSPENANRIGRKLAEEMWGDKYQIIICTHLNKENVHNHIILNSVSFVDGKKYHNSDVNIAFTREVSDRLCLENGLSIVNTPKSRKEKEIAKKRTDNFKRTDEKMQKVIYDIDESVKNAKTYYNFKLALEAKGYSNITDDGKYFSIKTPYYSRNVRIDKIFGDNYSAQSIKERIYGYKKVETMPFANYNKKYYKKIYKGPKIDWKLYKRNRFYAWYVAALYILGILPAKVIVQEVTVQDYKVRNKTKMVFEELNFINQSYSKSIDEIKTHKKEIGGKLPILRGKRENLWVKHKKANSAEEKNFILERISLLSDEISTLQGQRNACKRIIDTYKKVYEEV